VVGNRRTFYQGYATGRVEGHALTLNLGLRYEYYTVVHEILNRSAVDIAELRELLPQGHAVLRPNPKDFGPRVGVAWAPALFQGKTTIRSGFGIYYGGNQNDDFSIRRKARYRVTPCHRRMRRFPIRWSHFTRSQKSAVLAEALDRHRKDLYYENWDFVVQQQLPNDFVTRSPTSAAKDTTCSTSTR
jgi:hypothetical protein